MAGELEQIAKEVAACTKCPLHKGRTNTVPGEGSAKANLLFIGEAPGYNEDQQGRPFVGQSGQLLGHLLNAIKIQQEDVFIANVVKCRPPNNREPTNEEINTCKPYLDRQIAAIDPRVIVTLGRFSMARWFPGERISQVHGKSKEENGRIVMPMFHPAAALRDRTGPTMKAFKEDGLRIPDVLQKAEKLAATQLWGSLSMISTADETPMVEQSVPVTPTLADSPILEEKFEEKEAVATISVTETAQPENSVTEIPAAKPKNKPKKTVTAEATTEYKVIPPAANGATNGTPIETELLTEITEGDKKLPKAAKVPRKPKKKEDEQPIAEQLSLF